MKNYGKVQSHNRPQEVEIKESKVFIASNIEAYSATVGEYEETGYEYDYVEYTKDEYLSTQAAKISGLEEELAATKILLGVE